MIEAETLVVYKSNVLKVIEETDCNDLTQILETLFPGITVNKPNDTTLNQIKVELCCGTSTNWCAYIGTTTGKQLHAMNPNLYPCDDEDSEIIVITIPQGNKQRAIDNVVEMTKQKFALSLNGVMDRNH